MLTKVLLWMNLLCIGLTAGSYVAPFVHPENTWIIPFLGLAYPLFLIANICFMALWAGMRKRYFWLSFVCLLFGWPHFKGNFGLNFGSNDGISEGEIKVMTYNLHFFNFYELPGDHRNLSPERTKEVDQMKNLIIEENPAVLCLQEIGTPFMENFLEQLKSGSDYFLASDKKAPAIRILSKYPILKKGILDFPESNNAALFADLQVNDQIVRVYNLHLQSLKFDEADFETITQAPQSEKSSLKNFRKVAGKIRRANLKRAMQAEVVRKHMKESPYPVILCGDFNDTPSSYTYRQLASGLTDSFKEKGRGSGRTYAGPIPLQRIDYILVSAGFSVQDHQIIRKNFSDHFPVFTLLEMEP